MAIVIIYILLVMTSCMLYDRHLSACMLWAYSRSGIHGCTVTRAGNGIFFIQHKLDLYCREVGWGWFGGDYATLECLVMSVGNITLLGIRQIRLFILSYKRRYKSMNVGVLYLVKVEVSQLEYTSVKCKANYLQGEEGWEFFYHLLYH